MRDVVAGLDLGGTGCRVVVWANGGPVASRTYPTASFGDGGSEATLDRLAAAITGLVPDGCRLTAMGIGASGPVDIRAGTIDNSDTLPMFSGFPLVGWLQARFDVPVMIDNDAVTAAVAEQRLGAGAGAGRMLMVTLGTGIGVSFLVDGIPFRGPGQSHPEGGHIPILGGTGRCYCGADGCWELMASRGALQVLLRAHLPPDIASADLVVAALRSDDPAVAAAFEMYGRHLGRGLAALHTLYRPEVTVLGGSAAACLPRCAGALADVMARTPGFAVDCAIMQSTLGDNAGAIGGALMAGRIALLGVLRAD